MKIFRLLFFSLLFFVLLITGISLFFPSEIRISRATTVIAPADSIYAQLSDPARWIGWYPGLDSAHLVMNAEGRPQGIGMSVPVTGRDGLPVVGAEPLEKQLLVRERKPGQVVTGYLAPGRSEVRSGWSVFPDTQTPGASTVQWYMDFHLRWYPWEKFASLLFEKNYGPLMEQGLTNLKQRLES